MVLRRHAIPLILVLVIITGYVLYPVGAVLVESLRTDAGISLVRYASLLDPANRAGWEALWNSVWVSGLSVVLSACAGILLAFVLTQFSFRGSGLCRRLAVLPIALPPLVGVIAFLFVFGESGILPRVLQRVLGTAEVPLSLDGMSAIVVVHAYSFHVYFYLFVSDALRQMDSSQIEAARSLGAGGWMVFRRVMLPELQPALVGASALTFMASMASFSAPLLFAGQERFMTLQIYTSKLNGDMNGAAAQAIGLTVISVGFFVMLRASGSWSDGRRGTKGVSLLRPVQVRRWVRLVLIVCVGILLTLGMLPLLTILLISFAREGSWTWQVFPAEYTLENYARLLSDPGVLTPIRNSVLMSALALAACLLVGVTVAFILRWGKLGRVRTLLDVLATVPFAIPGTVVAIALILTFNTPSFLAGNTVLVGTFWILPLAYFIRTFPLVVRSTMAALAQLDNSLVEAAEGLGARTIERLRRVILPVVFPGIVSGSVLVVIAALGEFVSSILLYAYSSRPIAVEILSQLRIHNFGGAAAYCVLLLVLILLVVALSERLLQRSRRATPGVLG